MALVKCPECGNSVSDRAESCPRCAYPMYGVGTTQTHRGTVQTIDQTAKRSKRGLWLALLLFAALITTLFAPKFVLWFGIILLVLCIGGFLKTWADLVKLPNRMDTTTTVGKMVSRVLAVLPFVEGFSRRLLQINSSEKGRSGLRLAVYGFIGLVLIVAGRTGTEYKAERETIAAKKATEEAEQRRLVNEANATVAALVAEAESAWRNGNSALVEGKLEAASKTPNATELNSISQLRTRMANAKVEALVVDAKTALNAGDIDAARAKVKDALAAPHANALAGARKLDQKIDNATDPTRIRAALMEVSDEVFQQLKESGRMPAQMVSGYQELDRRTAELAKREVEKIAEARENRRLAQLEAERKRQEEARVAVETAARKAEADRQRKAEAQAEAKRKAEEEYDADGLVLLRKTVKGTRGQFGGEITGTVVNRRLRKLSYAQIQFNLYDKSGAQVGTALANINGLEPGGRWNFKATTFGTDFETYKFSELSGF